jgi:hypothetical protein
MNAIHYGRKTHLRTERADWSDNVYESVPFTCQAGLSDREVRERIIRAIYGKFRPSNGYDCNLKEFHREGPTGGHVIIRHYQGIGD